MIVSIHSCIANCDFPDPEVTTAEFEEAVSAALDAVPTALMDMLDNVAFFVEQEPSNDQPDDLLGIYEGVPLTERDIGWGAMTLPDRITLFKGPLSRLCESREELEEEINKPVVDVKVKGAELLDRLTAGLGIMALFVGAIWLGRKRYKKTHEVHHDEHT